MPLSSSTDQVRNACLCDFNPRIRGIVASTAVLNVLFVHFKHGELRCNGVAELSK